jgi:glycosyltransferase involved in cell wall biosynthesis
MVKKRHVLFIVENNPAPPDPRVWGEARAAYEFGYDVSIICPNRNQPKDAPKILEGIRIYRHPTREGRGKTAQIIEYCNALFWEFVLAIWVFVTHRFHLIHGANPPDHIFIVALFFKLFGVKYVFDHHDIAPENYAAKFGSKGVFFHLLRFMEWLTFKTADVVISTNASYKKLAMKRGGRKEQDVVVVRNGPDLSRIPSVVPNQALRNGSSFLVGYVGVIGQQEEIGNLLGAAEHIVKVRGRRDVKFIIVGTGPDWNEMVKQSLDMGLGEYVKFTGYVPYAEFYQTLATVDVCENPEFRNAFTDKSTMVKIMDYMTFGKPIVQFYTTEGEVTAGEAAVYVKRNSVREFADAVIELLDNPARREMMGSKGRRRIEETLGWEHQKINLKKAYGRVFREDQEAAGSLPEQSHSVGHLSEGEDGATSKRIAAK